MELVKAPWIRPGVIVHDPSVDVDDLLATFAAAVAARGFRIAGFVQCNNRQHRAHGEGCAERIEVRDLASGEGMRFDRDTCVADGRVDGHAVASLRAAMRDDVDLVVISRFAAMEKAATRLMASVEDGIAHGLPVLTSIAGRCLDKWYRFAGHGGALLSPNEAALWQWWGADRLYRDLALGVAEAPVIRIVCGPRWLMIEGPAGVGLAPLPKGPAPLLPQLPRLRRKSLHELAQLTGSWDALEMAVGVAAVNAHYNRFDLDASPGNGAPAFRHVEGRTLVIGAFPGLGAILPGAQVIEAQPRAGELPTIAMDTVLPGCAATVVSATSLVNRTLPRILRLAQGARLALIGPAAPMTPRLHAYGVEIIGGLRVRDPDGLARTIANGGLPREFERFGDFVHVSRGAGDAKSAPVRVDARERAALPASAVGCRPAATARARRCAG